MQKNNRLEKQTQGIKNKLSSTASDTAKCLSNHTDLYLWHTGSVYTNIFMHTLRIYLAEKQDKMPTVNGSAGFTSTKRRRFCLMRKFGMIYFNMSVCMHGGGSISRSLPFAPTTETPGNSKFMQASSLTIGTLAFITTGNVQPYQYDFEPFSLRSGNGFTELARSRNIHDALTLRCHHPASRPSRAL